MEYQTPHKKNLNPTCQSLPMSKKLLPNLYFSDPIVHLISFCFSLSTLFEDISSSLQFCPSYHQLAMLVAIDHPYLDSPTSRSTRQRPDPECYHRAQHNQPRALNMLHTSHKVPIPLALQSIPNQLGAKPIPASPTINLTHQIDPLDWLASELEIVEPTSLYNIPLIKLRNKTHNLLAARSNNTNPL